MSDPAYDYELDQLAEFCRRFLEAHESGDHLATMLTCGMLTAQCATVYTLSPPAGIVDYPAMFERDEEALGGQE